jgi:hypothetical protein
LQHGAAAEFEFQKISHGKTPWEKWNRPSLVL